MGAVEFALSLCALNRRGGWVSIAKWRQSSLRLHRTWKGAPRALLATLTSFLIFVAASFLTLTLSLLLRCSLDFRSILLV